MPAGGPAKGAEPSKVVPARAHGTSLLRTPAVVLGLLAVVLLVALVVPGSRHQLALSLERQPAGYLAVFLAEGQRIPSCDAAGQPVSVGFALRSHLDRPELVRYVVDVAPRGTGRPSTGRVRVTPGRVTQVRRTVVAPRSRPFRVVVALPGRDQGLRLRCRPSVAPS